MQTLSSTELNIADELKETSGLVSKLSFESQNYAKAESYGLELSPIKKGKSIEVTEVQAEAPKLKMTDWANLDPDVQLDILPQPFRYLDKLLNENILAPVYNYIILKDNNPLHLELKKSNINPLRLSKKPENNEYCTSKSNFGNVDLFLSQRKLKEVFLELYNREEKTYKIAKNVVFSRPIKRTAVCGLDDYRFLEVFCFGVLFMSGEFELYVYNLKTNTLEKAIYLRNESEDAVVQISDCFNVIVVKTSTEVRYYLTGLFERISRVFSQNIKKVSPNAKIEKKSSTQETIVPLVEESSYYPETFMLSDLTLIDQSEVVLGSKQGFDFYTQINQSALASDKSTTYLITESLDEHQLDLLVLEKADSGFKFKKLFSKQFTDPIHKTMLLTKCSSLVVSMKNGMMMQLEIPSLLVRKTVYEFNSVINHHQLDSKRKNVLIVAKNRILIANSDLDNLSKVFNIAGYDTHTLKKYPLLGLKSIRHLAYDDSNDLAYLLCNDGYIYRVNLKSRIIDELFMNDIGSEGRYLVYKGFSCFKDSFYINYYDNRSREMKTAAYAIPALNKM